MYNEILEGSIMEYLKGKDFVSDFAERTLANLYNMSKLSN